MLYLKDIFDLKKSGLFILIVCIFSLYSTSAFSAEILEADLTSSLDTDYEDGSYFAVFKDDSYVYVASYYTGLQLYSFDGNKLTFLDNHYSGGNENFYFDVTGDDEFVYTACYEGGLKAYSVYENKLVLKASVDNGGYYNALTCDDSYIYTSCYEDGIRAYSFDGKDKFELVSSLDEDGSYLDVYSDGNYIYSSGSNGLKVFSFNGSAFSLIDSVEQPDGETNWYWSVCSDGANVYTACDLGGIKVYSFDGNTLSYVTEIEDGQRYLSVDYVEDFVFTGSTEENGSIKQYYFTGDELNLISKTSEDQTCNGLLYKESYLFAACQNQGLKVYPVEEKTVPDDTEYLFDVKVTLSEGRFEEGKNIESLVELLKAEGDGISEGVLNYTILNKNNEIIWNDKDPSDTLIKSIETKVIPTGNLEPGTYTLNIKLEYGDNQTASASKTFEIKENKSESLFSNITVIFIALTACLLFLLLFSNKKYFRKILKRKK